jgi:hypothetical protein
VRHPHNKYYVTVVVQDSLNDIVVGESVFVNYNDAFAHDASTEMDFDTAIEVMHKLTKDIVVLNRISK